VTAHAAAVEPMPYEAFGSGRQFADVYQELKVEQLHAFEYEGRRMFVTRRTVLGRLRQHKLAAYDAYVRWCRAGAR
jgi:hypothetical protein